MPIRWDALLVRHVARELHARLAGAHLRAVRLDGDSGDALLLFRDDTLWWRLHPTRGQPLLGPALEPDAGDLPFRARVTSVHAPADERLIVLELAGRRRRAEAVVELLGNQWNAVLVERPEGVVRHLLHRREGPRPLAVGSPYAPPEPSGRAGADEPLRPERWAALLEELPAGDADARARVLVQRVAWTSPINAGWILGADDPVDPAASHARLMAISGPESHPAPVILETERGPTPYPFPLPPTASRATPSLLDAFAELARAGDERGAALAESGVAPELTRRLSATARAARKRADRLEEQLVRAEDPARMRALGDLILARYAEIPRGAEHAELTDFEGRSVTVALDPAEPPHENAAAYYRRAARAERARARLPDLIERAGAGAERLEALLARARAGEADAAEVRAALPAERSNTQRVGHAERLPYRRFRSSGGLEIRVGKGARHNDALTFHHAAPGDVWMHARHAAGAHVVLRWPGPGNPPARDLREAAVLAALHSKASTSGSVPVDWTLRKHVRKPRGAGPGTVAPDRVSTLFVTPDPEVEERLREKG